MRALISVYDKDGVVELAEALCERGVEILSSGGTFSVLQEAGIPVRAVEEVTRFPEMLDGRVKTLHPAVHGGLLALRDNKKHMETLEKQDIATIDFLIVNLYPFFEKVKEGLSFEETLEFIDIGGPAMLRSASKNFKDVVVLSDPSQYAEFLERFSKNDLSVDYRKRLAVRVFSYLSAYDTAIARFLSDETFLPFVADFAFKKELRYGENPHQRGAWYESLSDPGFMSDMEVLGGKALSFLNLRDVEASWRVVSDFAEPCACAVKHNTPCGVALGKNIEEAFQKCYECDPLSIFGGIVALNRKVDLATAKRLHALFLEVIVAEDFDEEALTLLREKKNLRLVKIQHPASKALQMVSVDGGLLLQEKDDEEVLEWKTCTRKEVDEATKRELLFAFKVVKHVHSNAIVISKNFAAVGIGGGEVNRIDAARMAIERAGRGGVMASDAFFPFDDVVKLAAEAGIQAIVQPGGSLRDSDSISACDELGIAMVFTGMRHFRHG